MVGPKDPHDPVEQLVQQVLEPEVRQCRISDPLKIADALRGRLGDGARVLLPGTKRDSLGADIRNVCDQDEAYCREQKGATDEIAGIG